jgi:hypothetical protein
LSTRPSPIKRLRATKAQVGARWTSLLQIVEQQRPMTVRQVFYQATVHNLVEKTEAGYRKVQHALAEMRRAGALPYHWIADNTRWQRKPTTFSSIEEALNDTARFYRKSLWHDANAYVEIWLEKDALAGVLMPVTVQYDVSLMVTRGYSSLSFLHTAAEHIAALAVPTFIYHFGDFDPSGVNAGLKIEQTLREMAPTAEIQFERVAVTARQIAEMDLPTRPTKSTDTRAKGFGDISVELDAIAPDALRGLAEQVIQRHLPAEQLDVLLAAEASEKQLLRGLVGMARQQLMEVPDA